MHWLEHFFGLDDLSGPIYGLWSGAGADLGELTLFAAVIGLFRRHNCAVKPCWRFGRHEAVVNGVKHMVCRKHHPDGHLRAGDLR